MLPEIKSVTLKHHEDVARYGQAGIVTETIRTEDGKIISHDIGAAGPYASKSYSPPSGRVVDGVITYSDRGSSTGWQWTDHAKQTLE